MKTPLNVEEITALINKILPPEEARKAINDWERQEANVACWRRSMKNAREIVESGDYVISGGWRRAYAVSQFGEHVAELGNCDAVVEFIREHADAGRFWPKVWVLGQNGEMIPTEWKW